MRLRDELVLVVSLGSGISCSSACPHNVVDRESVKMLDPMAACALAQKNTMSFNGPTIARSDCQLACGDTAITYCNLPSAYLSAVQTADGGTVICPAVSGTVALTCQVTHSEGTFHSGCPIAGRRPNGLWHEGTAPYLAQCASLEAAAVIAFERLADDLAAHGAPPDLVRRARIAMSEEIDHARRMTALAERRGAKPPRIEVPEAIPRPLVDIAIENVVEGVVRETYGAVVALHQAAYAKDSDVSHTMKSIAEDECSHAELSWDVHRWISERLSDSEHRDVARAKERAIEDLCTEPHVGSEPLGLPGAEAARAMLAELAVRVWARAPSA